MANSWTVLTLDLAGAPASVNYHCAHDDGQITWRINHGGEATIYLHGTPTELRAFAEAMTAEVEAYAQMGGRK